MMSITTRIFEICEMFDVSERKLSLEAGLSHGYMSKTRQLDREIGSNKVETIYHVLNKLINTKINPEWYLTGKGEKFVSMYMVDNKTGEMKVHDYSRQTDFEYRLITALESEDVKTKLKEVLSLK